jgi:outer membrane receptor protein involved in Fe transport
LARQMALIHVALAVVLAGAALAQNKTTLEVRDSAGLPIPGVALEIRDVTSVTTSHSDETGRTTFACHSGARVLIAGLGFQAMSVLMTNCPELLTVKLSPAAVSTTVDVVVRDEGVPAATSGSAAEIDRTTARTVLDAVENLSPGVFVTRRGVMGYGISSNGSGAISIRGVSGSPNTDVLMVVDGRPDFQGQMGHPLPDFYSLSDAGSISVTEGPASVLYGTNAMGGVVEVKPRVPEAGPEFELTSSLGSFMTGQHRLWAGLRKGRGAYSFSAGINHTAGDRDNSAFRSQNAALGASYVLSTVWKLSLDGNYGHFLVEDPGPVSAPLPNSYASVGRGGFSLDLANSTTLLNGYTRFYSSYGHNFISDGFRSVDRMTGGRIFETLTISRSAAVDFGADIVNYGGTARTVANPDAYGGNHQITDAAGFVRAHWSPIAPLLFDAGVRYQTNTQFGDLAVPEVGVAWSISRRVSWSAAGSEGFRNPTIRELYLFPGPNPALRPARMWNGQTSLQYRVSDDLAASVTYYYAHLIDQIVATGHYPNMLVVNQGDANNRGVETSLRWRVRRLSTSAGYAFVNSSNIAALVPRNKAIAAVDVDLKRAFLHLGVQAIGRRYTSAAYTTQLGGYTLASAKFSLPLRRNYDLFVTVDNVLNHRYQVLAGYPMPGVNAAAGFSVRFQ